MRYQQGRRLTAHSGGVTDSTTEEVPAGAILAEDGEALQAEDETYIEDES